MSTVPPIHREVLVDADPATAFDVFTTGISRWWPMAELSVHGDGATVAFVDGNIVESSAGKNDVLWGTVTRWEPPAAVAFTWHPGSIPERASHVEVTFDATEGGTLVTLEHRGWEVFEDPAAARDEYDGGWPRVLDLYRDQLNEEGGGETWVALVHRPGPAAPRTGSVFDDPRFADHVAFLTRMREAGYLVAAGPLTDKPGEGMTILRLPGADQMARATRLATEDDISVAHGFFDVAVRPWHVMLRARGHAADGERTQQ
jgi:prepilin-type processing-associated H-X9-DG protein